jgi:hypothetical protein
MRLRCRNCNAPPAETIAENILIVCSNCGMPLAEWDTPEQRAAELADFEARVRRHLAPRRTPPTKRQSKHESKSRLSKLGFQSMEENRLSLW